MMSTRPVKPCLIIVNADDFGRSAEINSRVDALMTTGAVTSATILANGPEFDGVAAVVARHPDRSFGVHLNVTDLPPVTNDPNLAPLLEDGCFAHPSYKLAEKDAALRKAILEEWSAQIEKVKALGVAPTHVDRNLYPPGERPQAIKRLKKEILRRQFHRVGYRTTDWFGPFASFIANPDGRGFVGKMIELETHPGLAAYDDENRVLAADWREKLRFPFKMISYRDV
jgi:hypothetical protein